MAPWLIPATKAYLKKERSTQFLGLRLSVPVGVFHPSLFFSTKTMCIFLMKQDLDKKKVLEIGSGSGAISIIAAKAGARVWATDINPESVHSTSRNATKNRVSIQTRHSDLFESLEEKEFDLILNNPPYYPQNPSTPADHAWYAGKDYQYFQRLFREARNYLSNEGMMMLVLSDECNIDLIGAIAEKENFKHQLVYTRSTLLEKNYIIQYSLNR